MEVVRIMSCIPCCGRPTVISTCWKYRHVVGTMPCSLMSTPSSVTDSILKLELFKHTLSRVDIIYLNIWNTHGLTNL